ncbi:MAG: TRAP transporter small permease subunit [Alcaligenaceae bacterium]|nr:TRAP transporter small permease subunit [Alcaligenaceae bacterium]
MGFLLSISRLIDSLNTFVGKFVTWLTLVVVVISAGNAVFRKLFHISSNAWLEIQWYLFGAVFLLAAGYTFLKNEHVRVDILSQRMSARTQVIIEIVCVLLFMLPACLLIIYLSWPFFMLSYETMEQSSNTGGLIRWPVKLLLPVGFSLLSLSGISHIIKCSAFLAGKGPNPLERENTKTAEEALAEEIALDAARREQNAGEK